MSDYITVSFSGGKDSTAMLLHMIELGEHIDEVITADTGLEFPAMYDHIARVDKVIQSHGIKHTTLKASESFEDIMLNREFTSEKWGTHNGAGWPTMRVRWCTAMLKTRLIDAHFKDLESKYNVIRCIGMAADETKRLEREYNQNPNHRHPLVEWGWTEADCLAYCYRNGYHWSIGERESGLYDQFKRVSCWCCPLQQIGELRVLWTLYPELWQQLEKWDDAVLTKQGHCQTEFKRGYTVRDLANRFSHEAYIERCQTRLEAYI